MEKEDAGSCPTPQSPPIAREERSAPDAPVANPRIWVLHCAFTKAGVPNVGNFGSTVQPVVIVPLATWQRLCETIPALATTQFEVGA